MEVNRINEIIEKFGYTPSEFADKIEVQRSSISHVTSGRNKPSLDFVLKIKQNLPDIRTDWLLFGEGKMLHSEEENLTENLPQNEADFDAKLTESEMQTSLFSVEEQASEKPSPTLVEENTTVESQEKEIEKTTALPLDSEIKQIVMFYNDGTFSSFKKRND